MHEQKSFWIIMLGKNLLNLSVSNKHFGTTAERRPEIYPMITRTMIFWRYRAEQPDASRRIAISGLNHLISTHVPVSPASASPASRFLFVGVQISGVFAAFRGSSGHFASFV